MQKIIKALTCSVRQVHLKRTWRKRRGNNTFEGFLRRSSTVSGTCFNAQVGQQVFDDTSGWWRVVLEAHSGEQVNEETFATLSEFCIFLDGDPAES